jgi:hypothetical protein
MDGAMIIVSMYCLNIFHPGQLFGSGDAPVKGMASLDSRINFLEKTKETGELPSCGYMPKRIIDERSKV